MGIGPCSRATAPYSLVIQCCEDRSVRVRQHRTLILYARLSISDSLKEDCELKFRLLCLLCALCFLPVVSGAQKMGAKPETKKTAKKMPPRDPKTGRFMKKPVVATTAKKMPVRDPKTGRFVKKSDTNMAVKAATTAKPGAKKMPARDPKTGKFIKTKK